jgi:molybdopterin synthase sulfur carrier subunit
MSMAYDLRFFAALREAVGTAQLAFESAAPTVGALRAELVAQGAPWAEALAPGRAVRASVNHVMADDNTPLPAGAEVAFFPPVTGG